MKTKSIFLAVSALAVMMLAGCGQNQPGKQHPGDNQCAKRSTNDGPVGYE